MTTAEDTRFYHGTRADLAVGDLLVPGRPSNYRPDVIMNHVYFTARVEPAVLAAALCPGPGRERVYIVAPLGTWEDDPNVTDRRFPGNPTRSYRSAEPLRILGELEGWAALDQASRDEWQSRLARITGDIIN